MEQYLGQLILFGGNFVIRGWAQCDGSILAISTNSALYSLLGTIYGGNGTTTFSLPDLRGRTVIGSGAGPGLSQHFIGEASGAESTTLLVPNLPAHNHALFANNGASTIGIPDSTVVLSQGPATGSGPTAKAGTIYSSNQPNGPLSPSSIGLTGNNQPVSIMQPYLVLNYQIALEGIFPSRS